MTGCTCPQPGWCERHGVHKSPHLHQLCQKKERYFQAWEEGRGPGQQGRPDRSPVRKMRYTHGPGRELAALLRLAGIRETPSCPCKQRSRIMNRWGPDKCWKQRQTIVAWMREEAERRGLPFSSLAALGVLRLAIWRARQRVV